MLSTKETALLANRLQAPAIIGDLLRMNDGMNDADFYALHETLSDQQPDTALLSIALCTRMVAGFYRAATPSMQVLDMECARIIADTAPLWLANAQGAPIDERETFDALDLIAEDLESLSELLALNLALLRAGNPRAAALLEALNIQAAAQALIAETFSGVLHSGETDTALPADRHSAAILPFPERTRH